MPIPTLYFIRHGETDWNLEGRLQGQRDIPLNDLGRVQAEEAGRKLAKLRANVEDLAYFASPLRRTRETIEIVRRALGLHPEFYRQDDRLKELSFGHWEGQTWDEVSRTDPLRAEAREKDKWHYVPPQGESYAMLKERVLPMIEAIERDAVVVSHGGVARCLMVALGGMSFEEAAHRPIWQGRVLIFDAKGCRWD